MFELQRLDKHELKRLASDLFSTTEIYVLWVLLHDIKSSYDIRPPPDFLIEQFAVDFGRIGGFTPTNRPLFPKVTILWRATRDFMITVKKCTKRKAFEEFSDDIQLRMGS